MKVYTVMFHMPRITLNDVFLTQREACDRVMRAYDDQVKTHEGEMDEACIAANREQLRQYCAFKLEGGDGGFCQTGRTLKKYVPWLDGKGWAMRSRLSVRDHVFVVLGVKEL